MTLSKASHKLSKALIAGVISLMGGTTSSCDSWFFDEQGDCSVHYEVAFTYTQNMAFADAFPRQVTSVTLFLVNKRGEVVLTKSESGAALSQPGYAMAIDTKPGIYDVIVWAEGDAAMTDHTAFTIGHGEYIVSLTATLPLSGTDGALYSDKDIQPLFHGMLSDVSFPDTYGQVELGPVDLTKDTKVFQILIQSIDGTPIDPADFTFSIEADNSALNYANVLTSTTPFAYHPWQVTPTVADFGAGTRTDEIVNGLMAELTTGRLTTDRKPKLVLHRNSDGEDVIRIDLLRYLLMVKGEYSRRLTDQQYLDRMDSYTLMFFLDSNRNWYTAGGVYINGWRVVPPQQEVVGW